MCWKNFTQYAHACTHDTPKPTFLAFSFLHSFTIPLYLATFRLQPHSSHILLLVFISILLAVSSSSKGTHRHSSVRALNSGS